MGVGGCHQRIHKSPFLRDSGKEDRYRAFAQSELLSTQNKEGPRPDTLKSQVLQDEIRGNATTTDFLIQ